MKKATAITIGDVAGIGPEVAFKALKDFEAEKFLIVGPANIIKKLNLDRFEIHDTGFLDESLLYCGQNLQSTGHASHLAVEIAAKMARDGAVASMVTAPISKTAWEMAGFSDPGHTELIGRIAGAHPVMAFIGTEDSGETLRVALATIHEPLRNVPDLIIEEKLVETITIITKDLRDRFGIASPKIGVAGLNPHAGESGRIGTEDSIIERAIARTASEGPFPADALFGPRLRRQFDLLLAMYHDQGLAPFKALTGGRGVNVTLGLAFLRTSPDHGTAFNIAGKGMADHTSMLEAIKLACGC